MLNSDETGSAAQLTSALQSLHAAGGAPSVRLMAQQIGNVSHTTVADALSGRRVPSWPVLESIVYVLGGEQERFKQLWLDARAASAARSRALAASTDHQDDEFADRYVSQVMSHTDWLDLQESGVDSRVSFEKIYVPQRVIATSSEEEMDLWTLDDQLRRVLLIADPGIGASTACRALMRRHAIERSREIPFLVQVREFAATIPPARSVVGYLEHVTETFFQVRPPDGALARLLSAGQALVIFDGLTEMTATAIKATVSIIEFFRQEFPEARVLVTARSADAQVRSDSGLFAEYKLAGFTMDQVADYVHRWFTLAPNVPDEDRRRLAQVFLAESAQIPGITINPLRLRLACQAYARDGIIPIDLAPAGVENKPTAGSSGAAQGRIVYVEDDHDWQELIRRALPDYLVDIASSYHEVLELLRAGTSYDIALVDLHLMNYGESNSRDALGGAVLELLRDKYPETRRILLTGMPPTSARWVFERYGLDDLLLKDGINLSQLRNVIEQTLVLARDKRSVPPVTQPREFEAE